MAIGMIDYGTGFGISNTEVGTYRWNGHAFNPNGVGYGQGWNPFEGDWDDVVLYNREDEFDLTGFQFGNEVVLFMVQFSTDESDNGYIHFTYYDPDDEPLCSFSTPWSISPSEEYYTAFFAIGLKSDRWGDKEIHKNGKYYAEADITYNNNTSHHYVYSFFDVVNCPTLERPGDTSGMIGKIWVEGTELCYICFQGYKMRAKTDGSYTYVDEDLAGKVWVEGNKIAFIDEYGVKRKTKLGDPFGHHDGLDELPDYPGTEYSGAIWVNNSWSDTYLMFVDEYGIKRRVGAGYVFGGDYQ